MGLVAVVVAGGDLPCSSGLEMVASTAPWFSHACFASGHFTISALSRPLKLKHCTGTGGMGWSGGAPAPQPSLPAPEPTISPLHLPQPYPAPMVLFPGSVPIPPHRTLLRKGIQPWGQPPLVGAGIGGGEGFTAVALLRLQM